MGNSYSVIPDTPDFLKWYEHYPRHEAKGDAKKAWEQTKHIRPPLEQMIKAIIYQTATNEQWHEGKKLIPLPATYLRREQWEDCPTFNLADFRNGKMWWETVSGVEAKAKELNFGEWNPRVDPTWQHYTARLRKMVEGSNVVPLKVAGE